MSSELGWGPPTNGFPWPPANLQVLSPFFTGAYDVRWDDPSTISTGPTSTRTYASAVVDVNGTPEVLTPASAVLTVTAAPLDVGFEVVIDAVTLTCVHGAPGADEFDGSSSDTSVVAASLAASVNAGSVHGFGVASATSSGADVTLEALTPGAGGNLIPIMVSDSGVVAPGMFSGGLDAAELVVGNAILTATSSERTEGGQDFKVGPTSFDTASSIADALTDPLNTASFVRAYSSGGSVILTAAIPGSDGNMIVLDTSSDAIHLSGTSLSGGSGGPECQGISNTEWTIVGVNVYRSDNGERGPYIRVNRFPVGSMFFRDAVDLTHVQEESVRWDGSWFSKGNAPGDRRWVFATYFKPVVKPHQPQVAGRANTRQIIPANAPTDVVVKIDGVQVAVDSIFGPTGQVTLINKPYYDSARDVWVPPRLPAEDGSSEVTVSYWYSRGAAQSKLDRTTQTFYKVTTVALDATSPSGYAETPLDYCPPVSVSQVETSDYIWREAVYRNAWILQQGGERVKLFKRKVSGIPCPCQVDERTLEYGKQPSNRCHTCFPPGTLVRTELGYRPIEQVKVGERVLSSDGLYHQVTRTFATPFNGRLFSISSTISTRATLSTPDHPFWVLRGAHSPKHGCGPKCNKYIERGDGMVRPNDVHQLPSGRWHARVQVNGARGVGRLVLGSFTSESEANLAVNTYRSQAIKPGHVLRWDDAANVKAGDWLVAGWPAEVHDIEQVEIPACFQKQTHLGMLRFGATVFSVDEDFLWVVGLYLAEGSTGTRHIAFSLHAKETDFQDRVFNFFSRYGYRPTVKIDGNKASVRVASTTLSRWFPAWVGRHCYNKRIPEELMRISGHKGMHLVQGLHDGDGSKRDREITQTSETLALQVAELLHRAGEQPLIRQHQATRLTPNGNKRRLAFVVSWAEASAVNVNRKGRWNFKGRVLARVRDVDSSAYTGFVYNLEVEGDHTYVVNGAIVHNCLGTGFVGAYDGPIDIIIAPDEADRRITQTPTGRRMEHSYEVWTGPSPAITQRDFVVKQTNERYSVGPVRRPASRGLPLQQHFTIAYLDEADARYKMPVDGVTQLPWPQTRTTDPNKPCDPQPPHPVGFDYQATTMETEVASMPDRLEQRGRTPVWANIVNGGNG